MANQTGDLAHRRPLSRPRSQDVERLETFSPSRIWAGLNGSRVGDLDRERAERDAARYAVAEAEARREAARRDEDTFRAQPAQLGDVAVRSRIHDAPPALLGPGPAPGVTRYRRAIGGRVTRR